MTVELLDIVKSVDEIKVYMRLSFRIENQLGMQVIRRRRGSRFVFYSATELMVATLYFRELIPTAGKL